MGATHLMRVVLDSNILFSALISPHGPPHRFYQSWRAKRFELATRQVHLDEIRRASRYPKFRDVLQSHRVGRMVNNLHGALVIGTLPQGHAATDPNDTWLLALADAAKADCLVTGDKRAGLLSRVRVGSARILTATDFCHKVLITD